MFSLLWIITFSKRCTWCITAVINKLSSWPQKYPQKHYELWTLTYDFMIREVVIWNRTEVCYQSCLCCWNFNSIPHPSYSHICQYQFMRDRALFRSLFSKLWCWKCELQSQNTFSLTFCMPFRGACVVNLIFFEYCPNCYFMNHFPVRIVWHVYLLYLASCLLSCYVKKVIFKTVCLLELLWVILGYSW